MPYLNFHRPCFFPTTEIDAKGKAVKRYRYKDMMTPYGNSDPWQTPPHFSRPV